jgi:transposase
MAARGVRAKKTEKLDDDNLARVQEALTGSNPITKKEACEMLNISYNTTRLSKILAEHDETMRFRAVRKSQLKGTKATDAEIKQVIEWYLNETPVSEIAKSMYRSSTFVKNIINRVGIPEKRPKTEQGSNHKIGFLPEECVSESFEPGETVWCARHDLPAIVKKVMPNTTQTNYMDKYGAECYHIYVIELTDFESLYFGFQKTGGFNAHSIAYDLGSLKHLEKYGVVI